MPAGAQITITDENGKTIFEHKSAKPFNSVVLSSPELVIGSTYTVSVGDQVETITIGSISNGGSSGFGMQGGGALISAPGRPIGVRNGLLA